MGWFARAFLALLTTSLTAHANTTCLAQLLGLGDRVAVGTDNSSRQVVEGLASRGNLLILGAPFDAMMDVDVVENVLVVKIVAVGGYDLNGRPMPQNSTSRDTSQSFARFLSALFWGLRTRMISDPSLVSARLEALEITNARLSRWLSAVGFSVTEFAASGAPTQALVIPREQILNVPRE